MPIPTAVWAKHINQKRLQACYVANYQSPVAVN
jgi:hypothetical protein